MSLNGLGIKAICKQRSYYRRRIVDEEKEIFTKSEKKCWIYNQIGGQWNPFNLIFCKNNPNTKISRRSSSKKPKLNKTELPFDERHIQMKQYHMKIPESKGKKEQNERNYFTLKFFVYDRTEKLRNEGGSLMTNKFSSLLQL